MAIERILLDGRAIAAAIVLRSGRHAWFWKIAYDESFARFSPGVMMSVVVTDDLLDDLGIVRTDSCATADHPMIDHLWRERLALCDRLVAVRPQAILRWHVGWSVCAPPASPEPRACATFFAASRMASCRRCDSSTSKQRQGK